MTQHTMPTSCSLCAELAQALEPFAELAAYIERERPEYNTDFHEVQVEGWPYSLGVGWLRAARAAVAKVRAAQGMETEGGDAKQAPGDSLTTRSRSDAPKD